MGMRIVVDSYDIEVPPVFVDACRKCDNGQHCNGVRGQACRCPDCQAGDRDRTTTKLLSDLLRPMLEPRL